MTKKADRVPKSPRSKKRKVFKPNKYSRNISQLEKIEEDENEYVPSARGHAQLDDGLYFGKY